MGRKILLPVRYDPKKQVIRHGSFGEILCSFPSGFCASVEAEIRQRTDIDDVANQICKAINAYRPIEDSDA